jgi:DNA-3-methyladenine glycosylase II
MLLETPEIFSFSECLWFLDRSFDDCSHTILGQKVRKIFKNEEERALAEIAFENQKISVKILSGAIDKEFIKAKIEHWLGLKEDLVSFYALLKKDPDFSFLPDSYFGLRDIGIPDFFETICWSIIGQQINLTFAYKLKRALVEEAANKIEFENKHYFSFPNPEEILKISDERLRELQFSKQKIVYIKGVAESILEGKLLEDMVWNLKTNTEKVNFLKSFKGIGEWTAQYVLLKYFKDPNATMYGDAGLNQVLFNLKGIPKKDSRAEQEAVYANFKGWESYLTFYLWRHLSGGSTSSPTASTGSLS